MSTISYALKGDVPDGFLGGVLAVGSGSLDVKQALEEGGGYIDVPDHEHLTLCVLDHYTPLERVERPAEPEVEPEPDTRRRKPAKATKPDETPTPDESAKSGEEN
jgi:hypothetical protein